MYEFSDDIPYEYIYPSNLHEIFPKIEEYEIHFYYYSEKKKIIVTPKDIHYETVLNKYYNQDRFHEHIFKCPNHLKTTNNSICKNTDENNNICNTNNNNNNENDIDNEWNKEEKKEENHNVDDDDDNKEDNKEEEEEEIDDSYYEEEQIGEEEEPDLYFELDSIYNREYNEQIKQLEKPNSSLEDTKKIIICLFSYKEEDDIGYDQYLHVDIPPVLISLKNNIYNSLQIMDINDFICSDSYPDYIQLFKDIITTQVFPNITTFSIKNEIFPECLCLFKRDHFPKLHIYDISEYINDKRYSPKFIIPSSLFPKSFIELIDIIILVNKDSSYEPGHYTFSDDIIQEFVQIKKYHDFHIKFDLINKTMKQYPSLNININYLKNLHININSNISDDISYKNINNMLQNMNYQNLETIFINLINKSKNDSVSFLKYSFSLLCKGNYHDVNSLEIYEDNVNDVSMNINYNITISELFDNFLSLFSANIHSLHIYYLIDHSLTDILNALYIHLKQNTFPNLEELKIVINCDEDIIFDINALFAFINRLKNEPLSLTSTFNCFQLEYKCDPYGFTISNIFKSFPSLSLYLNKPITFIDTCFYCSHASPVAELNLFFIINSHLHIALPNISYATQIINLLKTTSFPFLRFLRIADSYDFDYEGISLLISPLKEYYENHHYDLCF
ncbi:hypothetical protein WA158_000329 [Blastocystis sp. Blastoise]